MEIPGDSCACGDYDQNWLREDNMPVRSTNGCDQQRVRQRTRHGALKVVKHATVLYKVTVTWIAAVSISVEAAAVLKPAIQD